MKNLINKIANYFGYELIQREELRKILFPLVPIFKNQTVSLINKIKKIGYKETGKVIKPNSVYLTFGNQLETLLIQIHKEGDIAKVYRAINENNFDVLIKKIVEPNYSLNEAKEILEKNVQMINILKESDTQNVDYISYLNAAQDGMKKAIVKLRDLE